MYDILIIGGGPAGLTAALYAGRSGKRALLLEKAGFGGQIAWSPRVENYPGALSLPGAELAERMVEQALAVGTDTDIGTVTALRRAGTGWLAETEEGERYEARAVILAVGAEHRQLQLAGETELVGSGVSYCAVCDGSFYAGQDVAVAGGGDTALQEALLLSDICRRVYLIHRRRSFRGEAKLLDKLAQRENVEILTPCRITALRQEGGVLTGIAVEDTENGLTQEIPLAAVFAAYGQDPATRDFADVLELNDAGYVKAGEDCRTDRRGLFVAGDCRRKEVRQLTTAVADGACAALAACRYLDGEIEPLEIERKFLIRRPTEAQLAQYSQTRAQLRQIYLKKDEKGESRRIRESRCGESVTYTYTEKERLSDRTRIEREREITAEEFAALSREADPDRRPIEKERCCIRLDGHTLEVDVFPFWARQAFCEVELRSEDETFALPDWMEVIREVTDDRRYTNSALAKELPGEEV
ncbi:MAG: FAD-dependent oxidoreductase [Oscillospiraceae bacterium]|nr:FAD-dependent oxidoreductase [Oscillospiraceae bacterium]